MFYLFPFFVFCSNLISLITLKINIYNWIGYTFGIPESVMGMTFLAIGGCTPEMITGVIMSRRGKSLLINIQY